MRSVIIPMVNYAQNLVEMVEEGKEAEIKEKYRHIDNTILAEITSILDLDRFNIPKDQLLNFMVDRE
jgi:hypothetical protein